MFWKLWYENNLDIWKTNYALFFTAWGYELWIETSKDLWILLPLFIPLQSNKRNTVFFDFFRFFRSWPRRCICIALESSCLQELSKIGRYHFSFDNEEVGGRSMCQDISINVQIVTFWLFPTCGSPTPISIHFQCDVHDKLQTICASISPPRMEFCKPNSGNQNASVPAQIWPGSCLHVLGPSCSLDVLRVASWKVEEWHVPGDSSWFSRA